MMLSTIPIKLILLLTTTFLQAATPTSTPRQAACGTLPSPIPTPSISYLPDPFTNLAGQHNHHIRPMGRSPTRTQPPLPNHGTWNSPPNPLQSPPLSLVTPSQSPVPSTAPYPAIIAYGGGSIPAPAGVAMITYNNDQIAAQNDQSSRGQGLFYILYGSTHSAGALIAWAWGVDRILDALTQTPSARISPSSIGVTGCSRNGKGALVAGAFVPRIALTIPQESGSGGDASWRISDSIGSSTQTASEIVGKNVWFGTAFNAWATRVPPFRSPPACGPGLPASAPRYRKYRLCLAGAAVLLRRYERCKDHLSGCGGGGSIWLFAGWGP
ncbi:hypothetical protein DID88_004116 [Monilinia fructigena]|uniref:(4-O-methyl)-D-glucuronate--lignin esterase n=1 Tax=Monilinia fructigena TaxID=38457 RepID=A0A395IS98_9HELO|nr:hypothetical protein DID88_004116 [Monilinia fructigena]